MLIAVLLVVLIMVVIFHREIHDLIGVVFLALIAYALTSAREWYWQVLGWALVALVVLGAVASLIGRTKRGDKSAQE